MKFAEWKPSCLTGAQQPPYLLRLTLGPRSQSCSRSTTSAHPHYYYTLTHKCTRPATDSNLIKGSFYTPLSSTAVKDALASLLSQGTGLNWYLNFIHIPFIATSCLIMLKTALPNWPGKWGFPLFFQLTLEVRNVLVETRYTSAAIACKPKRVSKYSSVNVTYTC